MISSDGPVGETGKVSLYVALVKLRNGDVPLTELCVKKHFKTQKNGCLSQPEHQKGPKRNLIQIFLVIFLGGLAIHP